MTREEEHAIISRVRHGDTDAFEYLVVEYQNSVYNLAYRMVSTPEDAADMAQEAFVKAYNSLSQFREDSKFSVWLYRIVTNVCLDFLRSKKRRNEVSLSVEDKDGEDIQLDIADESSSPELLLEKKLTRESIQKGLNTLPEDYRSILLLREVRGMSYEEIASSLSLELGTVKSRIFRARKKLCSFLINEGNYPEYASSCKSEGGDSRE